MLQHQTNELPIPLADDEIQFIIELCGNDLDIDVKLKLEFARILRGKEVTISFTIAESQSLVELLLKKAEHAQDDVRKWAKDIAVWLTERTHKQSEIMH